MTRSPVVSCPWCMSSNIAWSHETGYMICQSCGAILGEILDDSAEESEPYKSGLFYLNGRPPKPSKHVEKTIQRVLVRGKIITRSKGNILVDSIANRKARQLVEEDDSLASVLRIVESDPILKARTFRSRVAIAYYILLRSRGTSKNRAITIASNMTGTSRKGLETTISKYESRIRRLESILS